MSSGPVSRMDDDEGRAGCLIEGYSDRLNGLSSSPENAQHVADALEVAEQGGRFAYEIWSATTSQRSRDAGASLHPDREGPPCSVSHPLAKTISAVAWESVGALRHGDDYVAALVSLLDVRVCLDDLLQRIAPVDDRPGPPGLDELLEEDKVLGTPTSRT